MNQKPVALYVGQRLKARRKALGLSQTELGEKIDVSYQQVQKYEAGTNEVKPDRMMQLCGVLGVPVTYFFPDNEHELVDPYSAEDYKIMGMIKRLRLRDRMLVANLVRSMGNV